MPNANGVWGDESGQALKAFRVSNGLNHNQLAHAMRSVAGLDKEGMRCNGGRLVELERNATSNGPGTTPNAVALQSLIDLRTLAAEDSDAFAEIVAAAKEAVKGGSGGGSRATASQGAAFIAQAS